MNHFQPKTILELGTSLGISTSYLASVNSESNIFTIEGSEEIAKIAKNNFKELELTNVRSISGNFDSELPLLLYVFRHSILFFLMAIIGKDTKLF